jgi:hypothetical protein
LTTCCSVVALELLAADPAVGLRHQDVPFVGQPAEVAQQRLVVGEREAR